MQSHKECRSSADKTTVKRLSNCDSYKNPSVVYWFRKGLTILKCHCWNAYKWQNFYFIVATKQVTVQYVRKWFAWERDRERENKELKTRAEQSGGNMYVWGCFVSPGVSNLHMINHCHHKVILLYSAEACHHIWFKVVRKNMHPEAAQWGHLKTWNVTHHQNHSLSNSTATLLKLCKKYLMLDRVQAAIKANGGNTQSNFHWKQYQQTFAENTCNSVQEILFDQLVLLV